MATVDINDLRSQRAALDAQIEQALQAGKLEALAKIRDLVLEFELTQQEVFRYVGGPGVKPPRAARYRHPDTGETWAGFGKRPLWLTKALSAGSKLEDFSVARQGATTPAPAPAAKKAVPAKKRRR